MTTQKRDAKGYGLNCRVDRNGLQEQVIQLYELSKKLMNISPSRHWGKFLSRVRKDHETKSTDYGIFKTPDHASSIS